MSDPVVKVSQKKLKKDRNFTILGSIEKGTSILSLYKETIVLLFLLEQCLWRTLLGTAGQQGGHDPSHMCARACVCARTHAHTHTHTTIHNEDSISKVEMSVLGEGMSAE